MLAGHPAISALHTIDRSLKRQGMLAQARGEWRLWRALRARRYDLVVHLTEHPRGAWLEASHRRALRRGARARRRRLAVARGVRAPLPDCRARRSRHTVETNLDALRRIGLWPDDADKALVLVPGADAEARARALLQAHGLARGGFVLVHPGSRWLFKCWPAAATAALLDRLAGDGWPLVLTGAPDPAERALVDGDPRRHARAGGRSLRPAHARRAGRADRRRAPVRRRRLGADAHGGGDGHAGGGAVRPQRRCRVGAVAGAAPRGRIGCALLPPLRQQRLRRQQPLRLPADAARSAGRGRGGRAAGRDRRPRGTDEARHRPPALHAVRRRGALRRARDRRAGRARRAGPRLHPQVAAGRQRQRPSR